MARAKRTERADARRRHRAELQAQAEAAATEAGETEGSAAQPQESGRSDRAKQGSKATALAGESLPKERVGFVAAMKLAYRPVHYREDLRLIVPLITRTHAIWPVAVMCLVGVGIFATTTNPNDFLVQVASMAVSYSPLLPAMLAGFLAPRASWLAGGIAGAMSGLSFAGLVLASAPALQLASRPQGVGILGFVGQVILYSVPLGVLIGAASGWYKRFLQLTGPANAARNRGRQPARKPAARRR